MVFRFGKYIGIIALVILAVVGIAFATGSFSVSPDKDVFYQPQYGSITCEAAGDGEVVDIQVPVEEGSKIHCPPVNQEKWDLEKDVDYKDARSVKKCRVKLWIPEDWDTIEIYYCDENGCQEKFNQSYGLFDNPPQAEYYDLTNIEGNFETTLESDEYIKFGKVQDCGIASCDDIETHLVMSFQAYKLNGLTKGAFVESITPIEQGCWMPTTQKIKNEVEEEDFTDLIFGGKEHGVNYIYKWEEVPEGIQGDKYTLNGKPVTCTPSAIYMLEEKKMESGNEYSFLKESTRAYTFEEFGVKCCPDMPNCNNNWQKKETTKKVEESCSIWDQEDNLYHTVNDKACQLRCEDGNWTAVNCHENECVGGCPSGICSAEYKCISLGPEDEPPYSTNGGNGGGIFDSGSGGIFDKIAEKLGNLFGINLSGMGVGLMLVVVALFFIMMFMMMFAVAIGG